MITGDQVKAARILLNCSQFTVAEAAGLDVREIVDLEAGRARLADDDLAKVKQALEAAGVEFPEDAAPRRADAV